MTNWPSIGVVAAITNPLTSGYLAYLAFADSWSKVADEVILVDGGSTDGSLELLREWIGEQHTICIVRNDLTYWGAGGKWHVDQSSVNLTIGLLSLNTDWGIPTGADHILDIRTASDLHKDLAAMNGFVLATCYRGKPGTYGIMHRLDDRTPLVNLRLLRQSGVEPVLGLDLDRGLRSDYPLYPTRKSCFRDPVTCMRKPTYGGHQIPLRGRGKLSFEVISYGHFFFNIEECLQKVRRWDQANARFLGIAPKHDMELRLLNGLNFIVDFHGKHDIMGWDHPAEVLRVVEQFYEPGMLGGAIRRISPAQEKAAKALRELLGLERHLRTRWLRARGYRGLKEMHQWVPLEAPDPEPLDVRKAYMEQDKYLPPKYRIDWSQALAISKATDSQENA